MSATVLLVALVLAQFQDDKPVTDAQKKAFLELLAKLPTKGEFFTAEAIAKAVPHTRVLLALTEKDVGDRDIYPFLALSSGLLERKKPRQYGLSHFKKIAHPTLKLFWAARLFLDKSSSPEIVAFLRKALNSKETARELSMMLGPDFEDFKELVILAYERGRLNRVELVKKRAIDAFPEYDKGGENDYTKKSMVFAPGQLLYAVRPLKQQGELIAYDLEKSTTRRLAIPQPKGFKAQNDFPWYFKDPVLSVSPSGALFCRWDIEGNGDHGLALLKKGSDSFAVKRVKLYLDNSLVLADRDGAWYLLQDGSRIAVYHVDRDLNLKRLGRGHHSIGFQDAHFIANGLLHLAWGGVVGEGNHVRMRCVDFDVSRQQWFHNRELYRLNKFVISTSRPTVLQLADESLHYLWGIDGGTKNGAATGLYYQAEADVKTVKVCDSYDYRAVAVGNRIVVCYTLKRSPEKVFFRVINHGVLGPVSEITAAKGHKFNLGPEYMLLYSESGRIWFVNTLTRNTLYELKLADAKKP
ncbi:MAG: hypothetical protein ACRELG_03185 [Gemmataceae bacterium]